ncbi:ABC-2 transporter permease [Clostridium sp. E02]|uniref:ABC-2 transporter permease n=1 Tax=Clostridium sp. E02 TaxID=2487134 RepID=UPI000F54C064|nr:ABC-2 transporter permease [Clostridium sp. E02]
MKGLILKDLYLLKNRKRFFLMLIVFSIAMVFTNDKAVFVINYITLIFALFTISTISYDEFDRGYSFLFTLPITRRQYVLEKYVFGLLVGGLPWGLVTFLVVLLQGMHNRDVASAIIQSLVLLLFVLLFLWVSIPLHFKYGSEKGRIAVTALFGGLVGIGYVVVKLLMQMGVDFKIVWIFFEAVNLWQLSLTIGVICVLLLLLSLHLSIGIMEKKEF